MRKVKIIDLLFSIVLLLEFAAGIFLFYQVDTLKMLSSTYELCITAVLIVVLIVLACLVYLSKKKAIKVTGIIISFFMIIVTSLLGCKIHNTKTMLSLVTDATKEVTSLGIYVSQKDPVTAVAQMGAYSFGYVSETEKKQIEELFDKIKEATGTNIHKETFHDITAMADAMMDTKINAIITGDVYLEMLSEISSEDDYTEFVASLRKVEEFTFKTVVNPVKEPKKTETEKESESFIVYISGIDTLGPTSKKSRSDVNILASVNTTTKTIQLVTTPRDYYVPLSVSHGVKDKLTHAGIYGIMCSKDTLSELYGIDIKYYFRLNLTGFEKIIDAIGGITVESDYDFCAGRYSFFKGANEVNGEQALVFARERHAFAAGDNQRGKDQMKVIEGVIKKCCTSAILKNYSELLKSVKGCFETDMPYDLIAKLVRKQLDDNTPWNINSYSVSGTGSRGSTYSMPGFKLYIIIPNMDTVIQGAKLLRENCL